MEVQFENQLKQKKEKLDKRQAESAELLKALTTFQKEGKDRHDEEVIKVEQIFRERLQVSESEWLSKDANLSDVITRMQAIHDNIGYTSIKRKENDSFVIEKASGGLALRGVLITDNPSDAVTLRQNLLRLPEDIKLDGPFKSQSEETKQFESQSTEEEFSKQVEMFGYSVSAAIKGGLWGVSAEVGSSYSKQNEEERKKARNLEKAYQSTIKYSFIPLASCSFKEHQLHLSKDSLTHLHCIDKLIGGLKLVHEECKEFFKTFGSHVFAGPLHFGGRFMWKSYSSGFKESEKKEVQALQSEAISAHMSTSFGKISGVTGGVNDSSMSGSLKRNCSEISTTEASLDIEITGGPPNVTCLPEWKNGLVENNCTWHLIDRGVVHVAVWDIIKMNHVDEFENHALLVSTMKEQWQKLYHTLQEDEKCLNDEVKNMTGLVSKWNQNPDQAKFESQLASLVNLKKRTCLNPTTWAKEYLSQQALKQFLQLVIHSCVKGSDEYSTRLKRHIQLLVEPIDLLITRVFPNEKATMKWLYNTEDPNPSIECQDFPSINRYFKMALEKVHSENPLLHERGLVSGSLPSQLAMTITTMVAKAAFSLRNHLQEKRQVYEDCFLTTMLYPFKYDPEEYRFMILMRRIDIENICETFLKESEDFFSLMEKKSLPTVQSYLFYLTVTLYDRLDVSEHYVKCHIKYLQNRLEVCSEVTDILVKLQSNNYDWEQFKIELESFTNDTIVKCDDVGVSLQCILEEKQGTYYDVVIEKHEQHDIQEDKVVSSLFIRLGLLNNYTEKLTLSDAITIREDTLDSGPAPLKVSNNSDVKIYPFRILQKIMAFDHRCRMPFIFSSPDRSEPYSDSDSSSCSDESNDETIHPMDGLLALIHCSDNFLRQNLFSRLATCQLAVPLLLPHPITHDPVFLVWAMRTIVKEFRVDDGTMISAPVINSPAPIVTFLRIGHHSMSKSELMSNVITTTGHPTFFHYNCEGGSAKRVLVNGLVEVSWCLPSKNETFFPNAITFANLHGDACQADFAKQTKFLSAVGSMHFVLLNEVGMTEGGLEHGTVNLLKTLSQAPGGIVVLQTCLKSQSSSKDFQKELRHILPDKRKLRIIKLYDMNAAERKDSIRKKITVNLKDLGGQSLEDVAQNCDVSLDEDDPECKRGKEMAMKFQSLAEEFQKTHPDESPKSLLTLQSIKLWHTWAEYDKEQYRQQGRGQMLMDVYSALLKKRMKQIRREQFENTNNISPMVTSFLSSILAHQGPVLWYYLHWVKFYLDNLSRKLLPPLHDQYREKRENLADIQMQQKQDEIAEKTCRTEMNRLNLALINASFGIEHLLREVSQMYEAVVLHDDAPTDIKDKIICLPKIAAQLLFDGFPMELLDGDAAHMPKQWVSAVLQSLSKILKDETNNPQVFVLSVLGIQSTGKSTLLNTLFGVQFSVSAGRCTRGAFMQLIPVHDCLSKKCGVKYFLIIDTEGLRAPRLDTIQTQKHDNELATFVIGIANLTIINIKGEISGDMDDILQTAVHAFLRMKKVNLKPSCHLVHQNVGDVAADEKLMTNRLNVKDKLDRMTFEAAKETGRETEIRFFNNIIDFNYQKNVAFFPSLWTGSPPMAPVSPAYSVEAQTLKHVIIQSHCRDTNTLLRLEKHLRELWKAILQEDFVFSFRNIFEIVAYNSLEDEYDKWSWDFKKKMMEWEKVAQSKLVGCIPELLVETYQELTKSLPQDICAMHAKYETQMNAFFDESKDKEIISKWKCNTAVKLQDLREKVKGHAESHCKQLFQSRRNRAAAEKKRKTLAVDIIERVKQLVVEFKKENIKKEDIERKFDESWIGWMGELTSSVETVTPPNVAHEVQKSLEECLKKHEKVLKDKLSDPQKGKSLKNWGEHLKLVVSSSHIKLTKLNFLRGLPLVYYGGECEKLAKLHTGILLNEVHEYLTKKRVSDNNFHPEFTTEMLHNLHTRVSTTVSDDFRFTEEYKVDISLTACGYAIQIFEDMAEAFRMKYDPVEYVKGDMQPYCRKLFMDQFEQIGREKTAADALCEQLKDPIKRYVIISVSTRVVDDMRHNSPWIRCKKTLIGHILLDIGQNLYENMDADYDFNDCAIFLQDAKASMKYWIRYYTETYCDDGSPSHLSQKILLELLEIIHFIGTKAKEVTHSFLQGLLTFNINDWLTEFHKTCLEGKLDVELSELCLRGGNEEFQNVRFFTEQLVEGLCLVLEDLKKYLHSIEYSSLLIFGLSPHDTIFDQVAGCTEQCPFCKAPCEHTNDEHPVSVRHSAEHRPRCLGGGSWESNNTMNLDICTAMFANDCLFLHTNNKWHPYRKYRDYYPHWNIYSDSSLEASSFWKWLVGHFAKDIQTLYGKSETSLPEDWKDLKWNHVKRVTKEAHGFE